MKKLALIAALAFPIFAFARTTLSSSDLGWFFTLPPDYPTEVSSEDTPGSSDWYIQCTNGEYVARSPRLTPPILAGLNSTFEAYYERLYYGSQGSANNWDTSIYGPLNRRSFYWNIVPLFGPWTIIRHPRAGGYIDVTDSIRQPEYLTPDYDMGRWRAYALDEDLAHPNAFMYGLGYDIPKYTTYLGYGVEWTNSTDRTWASYDANRAITNSVPDYTSLRNFNYQPTTRKVSRRLLDFDNYHSLWSHLQHWADSRNGSSLSSSTIKSFIYRPGWLNTSGDEAYWSTTALFGEHSSFFDFPEFGWTQTPVQSFDRPTCTAPVFDNFANDGYYKRTDPAGVSIPRSVFYNIYVDNPSWSYKNFGSGASCGYILDILDGLFPELDHYHMPPLTRRLSFNDLCFINQYLSLFDRTYDIPQFNGFDKYFSLTRTHQKTQTANATIYAYRLDNGEWIAPVEPTSLSWEAGYDVTNDLISTNSYGQARLSTRVSSSYTSGSVTITASGGGKSFCWQDTDWRSFMPLLSPYKRLRISSLSVGKSTVSAYMTFYSPSGSAVVSREIPLDTLPSFATLTGEGFTIIDRSFSKDFTPLIVGDEFNYSLGPHAPGPEAYQTKRIADATTWFVEGHHKYINLSQTQQSILQPLTHRGSDSLLRYRSVAADVTNIDVNSALNDALYDLADVLAEEDPDLSISDSWFSEVRSNAYYSPPTCIAKAYLAFEGVNEIWFDIDNGEITRCYYYNGGEEIDIADAFGGYTISFNLPGYGAPNPGSVVESTPKNADAYIQPLTRVDWDWHSLKRSKSED